MNFTYYCEGTDFYLDCDKQEIFTWEKSKSPSCAYQKRSVKLFRVLDSPECKIRKESVDVAIKAIEPQIKRIQHLYQGSKQDVHGNSIGKWEDSRHLDFLLDQVEGIADLCLEYDEI